MCFCGGARWKGGWGCGTYSPLVAVEILEERREGGAPNPVAVALGSEDEDRLGDRADPVGPLVLGGVPIRVLELARVVLNGRIPEAACQLASGGGMGHLSLTLQ